MPIRRELARMFPLRGSTQSDPPPSRACYTRGHCGCFGDRSTDGCESWEFGDLRSVVSESRLFTEIRAFIDRNEIT